MVFGPAIRVPADAAAASWVAPALGAFGTVGGVVPRGYERYLLLDYLGGPPLGWDGVGRLFAELVPVLEAHTSTPDRCWFAIWEGYGFDSSATLVAAGPGHGPSRWKLPRQRRRVQIEDARRNDSIGTALEEIPSFDLPHRRYHLVRGAVAAASQIEQPNGGAVQPPDLWWPDDRRWFVGGDTDLDWCYVAGPAELVEAVGATFPGRTRAVDWHAPNAIANG